MSPKPVAQFLSELEPRAKSPASAPDIRHHAPPQEDEAWARAFAEGKEEGLKLAAARHALERRKRETESERETLERMEEAEQRIGRLLADRLTDEVETLRSTIEDRLADCLHPLLAERIEGEALDALARDAARVCHDTKWSVRGPKKLVEAFMTRLPNELRAGASIVVDQSTDIAVKADETRLRTRIAEFRAQLARLK